MAELVFYEKPGCVGNQLQKKLLLELGHRLEVRDLINEQWTAERLRPFFGDRPVAQWFNESAHKVKDGTINIHGVDEAQALKLMLEEPMLIRRPLLQSGEIRQAGFVSGPVLDALDISLDPEKDLQTCPMPEPSTICHEVK
jgi:nitrogenase-associated protein